MSARLFTPARGSRQVLLPLVGILAMLVTLVAAQSSAVDAVEPEDDCAALEDADVGSEVVSITASLNTTGEAQGQAGLPEFCEIELRVAEMIDIAVWLPTDSYNGRLQSVGGGGYAGSISYSAMAGALRDGYATTSTDTGHDDGLGQFALNPDGSLNDQLIEDFASRSLFEMTAKTKSLIEAFYGEPEEYAYWNGCSTGGRQGLMQVQRTPEAYDGVLAVAPAINWDRFIPAELWPQVVMEEELGGPIESCKLQVATDAAIAACDTLDGVADGVLATPTDCDFDVQSLVGTETPCGIFTEADATVLEKIWEGPRTPEGEFLWYGMPMGAPLNALAGTNPFIIANIHYATWTEQDPTADYRELTYEGFTDFFRSSQEQFNDVIGTDEPDISAFRDAGGKLLMWHGWADQLIFAQGSIDYYERMLDVFNSREQTMDFARLFMAPGVFHCRGGYGPNQIDAFGALVEWVEAGDAPNSLTATQTAGGEVTTTRPLCAYPYVARWNGKGDTTDAASFDCKPNYGRWGTPGKR